MTKIGKQRIYRFFTYFGHHVLSLEIYSSWGPLDWRVIKDCQNLKSLYLSRLEEFQNYQSLLRVDNLEVLRLENCYSKFTSGFVNIVYNLKALKIDTIDTNALTTMLRNSPDIESFFWRDFHYYGDKGFNFRLLEIIPNVGKFCFYGNFYEIGNTSELDSLLKLERLTKLSLTFLRKTNISSFLSQLAKKGIMIELELLEVVVDKKFFEILTSFDTLQLLVLDATDSFCYLTPLVWPRKLKYLRLEDLMCTFDAFLATIKQLKYLERIDFKYCDIVEGDEDNFKDVAKMSQRIMCAIENSDRKQRLDVILPCNEEFDGDSTKQGCLIDSARLRVFKGELEEDHLRIRIDFGVDDE